MKRLLNRTGRFLADTFWIDKLFFETNEFYISPAKKKKQHIKIVQISDLHLHSIKYQLTLLTRKLNKLKPSLILFTGDAIDNAGNLPLLNQFLKMIDRDIKKAAILGNWEYQANIDITELKKVYAENNCDLLINQTIQYSFKKTTVSITGLDDFLRGEANFDAAIENYQQSRYHIVLNHCPQYNDYIIKQSSQQKGIDFILSGHTHGGQINLFGYTPYLPKGSGAYVNGWYRKDHPNQYVSKGIGTGSFFPVRLGARSEIAIFNLAI